MSDEVKIKESQESEKWKVKANGNKFEAFPVYLKANVKVKSKSIEDVFDVMDMKSVNLKRAGYLARIEKGKNLVFLNKDWFEKHCERV